MVSDRPRLLLHGLGATHAVWRSHRGTAPDLLGHGGSPWDPPYTFGKLAEAVLLVLPDTPVTVVGHSMGGVVGLALASLAPSRVAAVVTLGVKVVWSDEDVARASALADKPLRIFASRDEAAERFLKVSGLSGLIDRDDPMVDGGLTRTDEGWRLAQDPATFGVGVPDMTALLDAAPCPVVMARGEHDPLVSHEQLGALVPDPVTLAGLGHNAHVEDPDAVTELVRRGTIGR